MKNALRVVTRRIAPRVQPTDGSAPPRPATAEATSLVFVDKPLAWFKPSPHRVRKVGKKQVDRIVDSLGQFRVCRPLLVTQDGEVIDGHVVLEACRKLGLTHAPAIIIDHLSPAQTRALRLALNKTAELGKWDEAALRLEFEFLYEFEPDLAFFTGFETAEIDRLFNFGGDAQPPEPPPAGEIFSRSGDHWKCGDQEVLCGSASDVRSYETLLRGEAAQMLFSDPPYGCSIEGNVSKNHGEFIEGSGCDPAQMQQLHERGLKAAKPHLADGALIYLFIDGPGMLALLLALRTHDLEQKAFCVWDKQSGAMGSLYRNQAEFIVVAKSGTAAHINNIQLGRFGRTRTTVWSYPGLAQFGAGRDEALAMHPTVKPVGLVADAILDATHRKGLVLDPYVGSGTSLVAAHRTGRRGRGIEIDPKFVDVTIRRLEEAVGKPATLGDTGKTCAEIAQERQQASPTPSSQADA